MMLETRSGRVSVLLHEQGAPAWRAATGHPMIREIGEGTLPHGRFRGYFGQNILYLQDYARAIALIAGKAPDRAAIATLTRFLSQIVESEIPANLRFFERLGGDPSAIDAIDAPARMHRVTYAYTRHLLYVAAQGDCVEGLTAVLPCQWSYGELAVPLARALPQDPVYAEWIQMFGNDEYDGLVGETTALLDRLADPNDGERMRTLSRIFDTSTDFEVRFWDMAYGGLDD
jgi:thiaminase/transcriptional activator TenA